MTGKLSERFAALKPATAGNNADRNRGGRVQQRATQQKDKRAAQTQARRGVPANNKANNNADKKNNNKPAGKGEFWIFLGQEILSWSKTVPRNERWPLEQAKDRRKET